MNGTVAQQTDVAAARRLAWALLADRPERWRHTAGVAQRAAELAGAVDAARFLRRDGWADRVNALVAHHSGACYVARARGLHRELAEFPREVSPVADALTYADQTVGPNGVRMDLRTRLADMLHRHGPD